jgi:phosphatidylethanolamine/phosphatidyl-N-methylethanolamine N-methyltransferase
MRVRLINMCLDALAPGAPFIQFSYALVPPVQEKEGDFQIECSNWVLANLPPARVWVYRRQMN